MNKADLKALAALAVRDGAVSAKVRDFVLALNRRDLKQYLFFLKNEIARGRAVIKTAEKPDAKSVEAFRRRFPGKELRFVTDPSIGAGYVVEHGDDVVHFNVRNMIERTIQRAKER